MDTPANQPASSETPNNNGVAGRVAFFLVLAVILGVFYYFTRPEKVNAPNGESAAKNIGAQIVYVEGAVEYSDENGVWKRATNETVLGSGDSVEVVGIGKAIINLDDGSAIRLNKNSGATLTSLEPSHIIITNDKGQIYTRVAQADRVFDVSSADVVYQSVGTAYKTINEEKLKGVEVYESKVKILGVNDREVLVEQGNKYYVVNQANKKLENALVKITTAVMSKDEFLKWNQAEDKKVVEGTEETDANGIESIVTTTESGNAVVVEEEPATETATGILLAGKQVAGGVSLSWTVSGLSITNGFKLVKSVEINPVYPGDSYVYLTDNAVRTYKWDIADSKTYYFRVCQYNSDGKCLKYSNNVKVAAPVVNKPEPVATGGVKSIVLRSTGSGNVAWTVSGYSEQGFKVVWSKNTNPVYPTRDGDKYNFYSDPQQTSSALDAFSGAGTYFVRVCEYLGGKCGVYSNEIQVAL